ncbi:hypothetical protein FRX31_008243 [Thalictrum thalictroides]|uniref:Uncharacterized protein n=1 Tax=Thalictrum thalictroides TaxID=46969 RepID=A0A7J6X187_THATH|nr:hypothetical protein FRX31_008243 [Thalictrum thalictroides]
MQAATNTQQFNTTDMKCTLRVRVGQRIEYAGIVGGTSNFGHRSHGYCRKVIPKDGLGRP